MLFDLIPQSPSLQLDKTASVTRCRIWPKATDQSSSGNSRAQTGRRARWQGALCTSSFLPVSLCLPCFFPVVFCTFLSSVLDKPFPLFVQGSCIAYYSWKEIIFGWREHNWENFAVLVVAAETNYPCDERPPVFC